MPTRIEVNVEVMPTGDGWTCHVILSDADGSRTEHAVAVAPEDLARLDPGAADPTDLVRRSFDFLLAREPKAAILRSFALPLIGRYFPDYETEIRRG